MTYQYTTQAEVRRAFWTAHDELYLLAIRKQTLYKRQNEQPTDIRVAFVDYVDSLHRDGAISAALAQRVTL